MSGFINCPSWKIGFAAYGLQQHQRAQRVSKWSDPITPRLFQTNVSKKNPTGWYIQRVRLNKLGKIQWSDNAIQKSQKDIPLQVIH